MAESALGVFSIPSKFLKNLDTSIPAPTGLQTLFNKLEMGNSRILTMSQLESDQRIVFDINQESQMPHLTLPGSTTLIQHAVAEVKIAARLAVQDFLQVIPPEFGSTAPPLSQHQRRAWHSLRVLQDNVQKILRFGEWQAAMVLLYGYIPFLNTQHLNLNRDPNHFPQPVKAWSDPTADILGDLSNMADLIVEKGGQPDTIIIGSKVFNELIKNEKIAKLLDNNRIHMGIIAPRLQASGMVKIGELVIRGRTVSIFENTSLFEVADGTFKPYIPPHAVVLFDSNQEMITYTTPPTILREFSMGQFRAKNIMCESFSWAEQGSAIHVGTAACLLLLATRPNWTATLMSDRSTIDVTKLKDETKKYV
jgi:Phage major capsid protein E